MKWKKESSDSCQNGGGQKPFRPTIEPFTADHPEQHDEASENRDETDERVNDRVDVQDHGDPITSVLSDRKARSGPTAPVVRRLAFVLKGQL